jgi:hypothetical protein
MGECEPLLTTFRFNSPKGVVGAPIKFVFRGRSRGEPMDCQLMTQCVEDANLSLHRISAIAADQA